MKTDCMIFWPHRQCDTVVYLVCVQLTKATWPKHPGISCYWFCFVLLMSSSPDINNVAMSLFDIMFNVLQVRLKEAQQKEQELNDKLRQYRDDLKAVEVSVLFIIMLMCVTGKFMVLICTVSRVQGTNWSNPRRHWKRARPPWTGEWRNWPSN